MDTEIIAGDGFAPGRRVGAILGDARAARGVELSDIARETRVPVRHLAAIEADAHDDLPALPYAIGFVKAFARTVGVDPDAAGAQFRAETSKTAHVPAPPPMAPLDERRLPPRGLVSASLAAVVAVIGGVVAWSAGAFDTVDRAAPAVAASTATAAQPATTPAVIAANAPASAPNTSASAMTANAAALPTTSSVAVMTPVTAGVSAAASGVAPPAPVQGTGGTVVITASEDAWFRVSGWSAAANKVVAVKSGVLAKGERYVVPPMAGLKLWTGRAGALAITVDGRAVPSLGAAVETVKNVSLDPAALRGRIAGPPPGVVGR